MHGMTLRSRRTRRRVVALRAATLAFAAATAAATAATALAPRPAAADSIVYLRDGNVWRATPDGATNVQLTTDGGYGEPSQADDGSIVVTAGRNLRRLGPDGTPRGDLPTTALADENWAGPLDPDVSPDGSKVAYSWFYESRGATTPGCPLSPDECTLGYIRAGTTVSWTDRPTALGEIGWWRYWSQPSWIGNDRLLLAGHDVPVMFDRAGIGTLGAQGEAPSPWFGAASHLADGDLTRAGDRVAYVTGIGQDALSVWQVNGPPGTAPPTFCFSFLGPSGHFADPTWSTDGRTLYWSEDDGIWAATIPGCGGDGVESRKIVPLGKLPDVGPADLVVQPPPPPPPPRDDTRRTTPPPDDAHRRSQPRPARRCRVPRTRKGAPASTVTRALARAGCRAKVRKVRSTAVRRGRVVKLSARAGRTLPYRAVVTVTVSRGRR